MKPNELKSAEEWIINELAEMLGCSGDDFASKPNEKHEFKIFIEKIQLNAYKAGMTEAADKITYWWKCHESRLRMFPDNCCIKSEINDCKELEKAILTARDNKTL